MLIALKATGSKPAHSRRKRKAKKRIQNFTKDLQTAAHRALPSGIKPYNDVHVLAIHWTNDRMGVASLEDDLCQIFSTVYEYTIEKFALDAMLSRFDAYRIFTERMFIFVGEHGKEGNLLIAVYSGYAAYKSTTNQYLIAGDIDKNSDLVIPAINWWTATASLSETAGDVLVIMDCCYASRTAVSNSEPGPELLAASTCETTAGAELSTSFIKNLTNQLQLLNGKPTSMATLYTLIHRSAEEIYPLHAIKTDKDSIVLARLPPAPIIQSSIDSIQPKEKPVITQPSIGPVKPKEERVIITVHLSDTDGAPGDLHQWTTWLTSDLPSYIDRTQISIEGIFESDSSIILVSLPLEIWTMLPANDEAYHFVSFVRSGNLLLPRRALPVPLATSS